VISPRSHGGHGGSTEKTEEDLHRRRRDAEKGILGWGEAEAGVLRRGFEGTEEAQRRRRVRDEIAS
jgi:hypothetical protein